MEGDEALRMGERNNPIFGKDLYYFSILGTPSEKMPWMLQFGGHHLALNITIAGEQGILTPSLTAAQPALFTMNGKTVRPLGQENDKAFALLGLKLSAMNDRQRTMLLDLISEWAGIVHDGAATARMAEIKAGLEETWFAWSGPITATPGKNGSSYYRIQGPRLVIEYAPQGSTNHIHTIIRDPSNDYAKQLTSTLK